VSLAIANRKVSNCVVIGSVYTPPHFRGKGYAMACVSHLCRKILNEGWKFCALYADRANPDSNKVYQKIGFKDVFYYDQYKIASELSCISVLRNL
jgi:predicted GNAT family acetyltransferase